MAYRRALASGLQRLARQAQVSGSAGAAQALASTEPAAATRTFPSALQYARCFAAQPAPVQEAVPEGKVTQVRPAI
jgi:hypothetical protein